jgi:hypothetical protein
MVKAPIFQGAIKLRNVLDCQAKILEEVIDRKGGSFGVISLALPRVSKRLTMGRSAEGEIKHACRLVSLRSEAAGVTSLG